VATYRYVLTDRSGHASGELQNASGRSLSKTLNGIDTATFTLQLSDPMARELVNPDSTGEIPERLLKIYRQDDAAPVLLFHGPVVDAEAVYTGVGGTVQVNAASPLWTLQHRLAGKDAIGANRTAKPASGERAQIARSVITAANSEGNTGVGLWPSVTTTALTSVDDIAYRPVAELITELSRGQLGASAADGFDFSIDPQEYSSGTIGLFRVGPANPDPRNLNDALIGRTLDEVVFELGPGTRGSALSARQTITRQGLANVVLHTLNEGEVVVGAANSPSVTARGRHEAVLTEDISDANYRQQLVDLHVNTRRVPRRVITLDPAAEEQSINVPRAYVDYAIGDVISLRVVDSDGVVALNDGVRVYGINTAIDDTSGVGRHSLTVVAES
jgi:hypothetical protein